MSIKESLSLSGKGVLDERAKILAESIQIEADKIVADHRSRVARLKTKIANHEDLAVDSRDSLRPVKADFDVSKWVSEGIDLQKQLRLAEIELALVQSWYLDKFPETE